MNESSKALVNRSNRGSPATNSKRRVRTRGWAWLASGVLIVALGDDIDKMVSDDGPIVAPFEIVTAIAMAMATISVITGCVLLVGSAGSTRRSVFRFRRLATVSTAIAVAASYSILAMVIRPPFAHLIGRGRFAASDVVDLGHLAVVLICLTFAAVGLSETWVAYREERRWPEMLPKRP